MNTADALSAPPIRKKRRWWLYLLIGVGALVLLGLIGIIGVLLYAQSLVKNYTAATPRTFPKAEHDPQRQKQLENQWIEFAKAIQGRRTPPPFTIGADDINQFLSKNREFRDRVRFGIVSNRLQAQFTFPLDQTGRKELKGRHLNGVAEINLLFEEGWLTASIASVSANGKPAPGWLVNRLRQENLVKDLDRNQELVNIFQEIESIRIQGSNIVITPRGR